MSISTSGKIVILQLWKGSVKCSPSRQLIWHLESTWEACVFKSVGRRWRNWDLQVENLKKIFVLFCQIRSRSAPQKHWSMTFHRNIYFFHFPWILFHPSNSDYDVRNQGRPSTEFFNEEKFDFSDFFPVLCQPLLSFWRCESVFHEMMMIWWWCHKKEHRNLLQKSDHPKNIQRAPIIVDISRLKAVNIQKV